MRRYALITLFTLAVPWLAQAQCVDNGYTVVFVNGILNSREKAEQSKFALQQKLGKQFNGESLFVRLGYNTTHLAGAGDLLQAAVQGFGTSVTNYDRDTILLQIYPELTTRKVLLVGHSQGTFYTNNLYDYLVTNGEPKNSIGVYNVATPANYVAGGGLYLTSEFDVMIKAYADGAAKVGGVPPLRPNSTLYGGDSLGHSFVETYMAEASDRIVADVSGGLSRLIAENATDTGGCFTPPAQGLGYNTQAVLFAVADPVAVGIKTGSVAAYQGAVAVKDGVVWGLGAIGSAAQTLNPFAWGEPHTENVPGSFTVVGSLYGSSLDEGDLHELLGASVASAVPAKKPVQAQTQSQPKPVLTEQSSPTAEEPSGEVAGVGIEVPSSPVSPVVPPPNFVELQSPGYGGGGGGGAAVASINDSEADVVATTTATSTEAIATTTDEVASTTNEVATSTPEVPAYTALYSQTGAAVLGETAGGRTAGSLAIQTLGTGLQGIAGSVLYKIHGSGLADRISQGLGEVILFACPTSGYSSCVTSASSNFKPVIVAAAGDDAYVLVTFTGSDTNPYVFNPDLYYMLEFITFEDMALWGSAHDSYAGGEARWVYDLGYTLDAQVADNAFRICSTTTCGDSF
jgi:hypothetical protein